MNISKSTTAVLLFLLAITFGACTQDEHMDEIMEKTEINQPSTQSGGDDPKNEENDPG